MSLEYKLNSLKQTWVGVLTDISDRKELGNAVDGLTSLSEGLGGIIHKLGVLKTAIIGIGTVVGSQKLGLFNTNDTSTLFGAINSSYLNKKYATEYQSVLSQYTGTNAQYFKTADFMGKSETVRNNLTDIQAQINNGSITLEEGLTKANTLLVNCQNNATKLGSTFANIGKTLVNGLVSAGISILITAAISLLSKLADQLVITAKEAENLSSKFSDAFSSMAQNQSKVSGEIRDIQGDFDYLSKGVNALGENVSLTDEEFERYHEITSSIAENMPELIAGYDEQGNAIIRLTENVNSLSEAYQKNQQLASQDLYNQKDEDGNIIAGVFEKANRMFEKEQYIFDTGTQMFDHSKYADFAEQLSTRKQLSQTSFKEAQELFKQNGTYARYLLSEAGMTVTTTEQQFKEVHAKLSQEAQKFESDVNSNATRIAQAGLTYAKTLDSYYEQLNSSQEKYFNLFINTLDHDYLQANGWYDQATMEQGVTSLIEQFSKLSDKDLEQIDLRMNLSAQFNNGDISLSEYYSSIQEITSWLYTLPKDTQRIVRMIFKLDTEGEGINDKVDHLKKLMGDNWKDEYLDEFSAEDLEVLMKIEPKYDFEYDEKGNLLTKYLDTYDEKGNHIKIPIDPEVDAYDIEELKEKMSEDLSPVEIEIKAKTTDLVSDLDTFEDKIDSLATAYESAVTNATYVAASDLQSLNDDFGGMKDDNGDYTAMASSIEKFNDTVTQNIGDTGANQAAVNDLLTSYLDLSGTLEDLIDEGEDYAKQVLKNQGVENAEEVVASRLNKTYKTTRANLVALTKALNQETSSNTKFLDVLESGIRSGTDFEETCAGLVDSVKQLVAVYNQETGEVEGTFDDIIDADFVADNIEDIIGLFNGVEGSLDNLYAKVAEINAKKVYIEAGLDDSEITSKMTGISEMLAIANTWTMEPEALLENSQFMEALNACWDGSVETANAINAALSTIGMKVQYKKTTNKIRVAKGSDSNAHTVYGGANAGKVMTADTIEVDDFEIVATPTGKGTTGSNANYTGSPSSSSNSGGSGDGSDSSSNSEETFDWIEVAIDRLENNLDKLSETIDSTYENWESRNKAITKSIDEVNREIELQEEGAAEYLKKAESINLSEDWKKKVREGKIEIDTVSDDTLKTNIQNYQTWWEKYQDAMDKSKTLTQTIQGYYKQLFDNVSSQYDQLLDNISSKTELIDERISRMEEHGYFVDEQYYKKQQSLEEENQKTLVKERAKLIEKLEDAVSKGTIKKGSESWQDMYQKIQDVNKQIEESKTKMVELNNAIRQLRWDKFDFIMEELKDINEEASFLQNLFEDKNKFKNNVTVKGDSKKYSNGEFSNVGLANAALTVSRYEEDLREATRYKNEIIAINKELAKDGKKNDQELISRKKELVSSYRESIEAAKAEKQAIKSLVQEAFEKHLEALQKLIDKYTESLNAAKDLYDYQKNINDQTKNLAKLQKQLAAYENDDSEGARKRKLELQQQIDSAQQSLQETQWDRYISETTDTLNKVYEDYSNYLDEKLEDVDALLKNIIDEVNENPDKVAKAFAEIYKEWGLDKNSIQYYDWNSTDNMQSTLVTAFHTSFKEYAKKWDTTKTEIGDIHSTLKDMLVEITNSNNDANGNTTNNEKAETKTNGKGKIVAVGNQSMNLKETPTGNVKLTPTGSTEEDKNFLQDEKNKAKAIADDEKQKSKTESKTKVTPKNAWWRGKWYDAKGKVVSKYSLGQFVWDSTGQWYRYAVAGDKEWHWEKDCSRTIDGKIYYFNSKGYVIQDKTKKAPGYAKGTSNVPEDQLAWTQENEKGELIYRTKDGAILTPLNKGDMVFTHDMTQRLWEIAKNNIPTGTQGTAVVRSTANFGDSNVNASFTINLPNVKNYDQFKKELQNDNNFEKFVKEITIGQLNGNNTLNKRKY